jgi:hypothetical protein
MGSIFSTEKKGEKKKRLPPETHVYCDQLALQLIAVRTVGVSGGGM